MKTVRKTSSLQLLDRTSTSPFFFSIRFCMIGVLFVSLDSSCYYVCTLIEFGRNYAVVVVVKFGQRLGWNYSLGRFLASWMFMNLQGVLDDVHLFLIFFLFDLKMYEREKGEVFLIVIGDCQKISDAWDSEMTELPLHLRLGGKDCKDL